MYKIALNAGHGLNTLGKRCDKKLDKNQTREWALNSRVCDKVEAKLKAYEGYALIRCDDVTGKTDPAISKRTKKANDFKANVYVSVHHNAGVNRGKGGGIMAFVFTKVDAATKAIQKALYNAVIKHTGLKGNRASPITSANFAELRQTKMKAVLLELGFMDSATDVPIILTDKFADQAAQGIVDALVADGKLKKKPEPPKPSTKYIVQVGVFTDKNNADALVKKLKTAGFPAIIKQEAV